MAGKDVLIAFDQLVNTLVGGRADESISARAWRLRHTSRGWGVTRRVIDRLFFWDGDHCYKSYCAEATRRHLPAEYRQ